jgi:GNAT superfamily N-acetyltransferase
MSVSFQREIAHEVIAEIAPLLARHWEEIAHFKDIPLNPDFDAYRRMEDAGLLRVFTARLDGELIGYAVFFTVRNLHYSYLQAHQDLLFLAPEHRNGRIGFCLLKYSDEVLQQEGVRVISHHVKVAHDFGPLLRRLGYELIEHNWFKQVK